MTYGFHAENAEGKATMSTGFPLLKFAGKTSVASDSYTNLYPTLININIREIVLLTPVIPGSNPPVVFFYMNNSAHAGRPMMPTRIVSAGGGRWHIGILTNEIRDTPPTGYCFYAAPGAVSGDTHGIQLFDEIGGVIFDSGWVKNTVLSVQEVGTVVATTNNTYTVQGSIAKPAFPFRLNHFETLSYGYYSGYYYAVMACLGLTRASSVYTVKLGVVEQARNVTSIIEYELTDAQTHYLPIIDGARYD